MSKIKSMITLALVALGITAFTPNALAATVTCERAVLNSGQSTNLVEHFTYTAKPTTELGGVFRVNDGATLTGTNVTFAGNTSEKTGTIISGRGGAICCYGTMALKDATFTGNTAEWSGGAINFGFGAMSLDNVTFEGNTAASTGGAIHNSQGTVNLDGPVTLVTTNDTVYNSGTLNWNLADGKQGQLNGYDKLDNHGTLQLRIDDAIVAPANIVLATGDFSDVSGKDTFSITNVTAEAEALEIKINGSAVASADKWTGYQLVTEEAGTTTNLVLNVTQYTCVRTELKDGESTNLVENFIYTAAPTDKSGGVFYVTGENTELTGTKVTFKDNVASSGGAIYNCASFDPSLDVGRVSFDDVIFTDNTASSGNGGAIYNGFGSLLSLGDVAFTNNVAKKGNAPQGRGGAIYNTGRVDIRGEVTLGTESDTLYNTKSLNWILAQGDQGVLGGYQYLENAGDDASMTVFYDYLFDLDLPSRLVIARGDFSDVKGKDTFTITTTELGENFFMTNVTINGSLVGVLDGQYGFKLVTEERLDAVPPTTNLLLCAYELTDRIVVEAGASTNLVSGKVYTAAPTTEPGGAIYVEKDGELTGTNVTFEANEAEDSLGGAIHTMGGTVSLKDTTFKGNKAWSAGALNNLNGLVNLDGVTFDGNKADHGGAITSSGLINLDGPVTLVTASDTIDLMPGDGVQANEWYWDSVLNWNLAGGKAGQLNGYDKLINEAGTLKLTIADYATPTNFVIATGDFTDVEGKDTFTIMNVTANGAAAVIKIGGIALLDGTWWKLAIEENELVLSNPATAKLSDVLVIDPETGATNATAVVKVNSVTVEPDEDGNYNLPQGYPVILNYTAQDDYVFQGGLKERMVVLDPLTGDTRMEETGYKPVAEPMWSDTRIVALDTRERIVVATPNDILPIAYSKDNWGELTANQVIVSYHRDEELPTQLVDANENGYVEWLPTYGEYGKYSFGQAWLNAGTPVTATNATIYYSQPYALKQAADGDGTFDLSAYTFEEGTVFGYDLVDIVAKPAEDSEFVCWTLFTNGVEVADAFEDARALTNRFEMPRTETKILATFSTKTGCTVNGQDIARGKGEGWEYTPAASPKLGTLQLRGDEIAKITLSGKLPSHTKITAKASEDTILKELVLENFTNDVSDCDAKVALTVPNFKDKYGTVYFNGENYLAAGARASAINVVMQDVTFMGTGSLTAIPGTDKTVLPAINCVLGTCRIDQGTYNNAVDPALVTHEGVAGFSNGDGTWTVKEYVVVTFEYQPGVVYTVVTNAKNECVAKPVNPAHRTSPKTLAFGYWSIPSQGIPWDFSTPVTDDMVLVANYKIANAAYVDEKGVTNSATSVESAITNAPAGGTVVSGNKIEVTDVDKPVVIVGNKTKGVNVEPLPGSDLVVAYSTNDVGNTVMAVVGEMTQGAETSLVVVKGEALPSIETVIVEKPAEGITKELVEAATNFVRTVTAENLLALPADAMYPMAVDVVQTHGGADAIRTQIKLDVVAWDLEPGAKGTLASVEMDVTPIFEVYRVKEGELENSPVAMYKPSSLQLSGEPVTVSFSLAALGQTPKLIEHELTNGDVEYFYHPDDAKAGEKSFDYDPVAKTISFEMTSFSPLTVYFAEEQFPVLLQAGEGGYFGAPGFTTRKVYESTIGTGKYRNLVDPTPAKDGDFGGWYYNSATTVANGDDFAKAGAHALAAKWLYEQKVTVNTSVGGTVSGGGMYRIGSTVTVTAFPDANWVFKYWWGDPISGNIANPTSFTMPEDEVTVTAYFEVSPAYRAQCERELAQNLIAATDYLSELPLTDAERTLLTAALDEAAAKARTAIANGTTPAVVGAALAAANKSFGETLATAEKLADQRVAAWDVGAELPGAVCAELATNGTLYVSGLGPMRDYTGKDVAPWVAEGYADRFDTVVVDTNVTHIGSRAFADCTALETLDLTRFAEFSDRPVAFFGEDVFDGTEGVAVKVASVDAYKSLARLPSFRALDPRPAIDAPPVPFEFLRTAYETVEGEELDVTVFGGKADRTTSVTVNFIKGTYTTSPTVYVDGEKAKFPLTLTWARGEIGEKTITLVTKSARKVDLDRAFTLQLGSPAGNDVGETSVATVVVEDAVTPVMTDVDYVRALAWPANGGKVTGAGELKTAKTKLTLKAKANKFATFAGWYGAKKGNPNQIDLDNLITLGEKLPVGYGTEYGEGTYYAYFTDVLPVASVIDPDPTATGAAGVTYGEGYNSYAGMVGVQVCLPVGLDDESGKGSLTVSSLPAGLKFDRKTGVIYGAPTKACEKEVRVIAKNAAGKQTVYYTFTIEEIPANAIGTWNGVVRKLDDPEDPTHAGFGTVQFTAGKNGSLSAKVTTRLTGTKGFSAKGYTIVDENTLGVEMATKQGETFTAVLSLTNDWKTAQLIGAVTGGAYAENGEECYFAAIRNAFDKKDGNEEALAALDLYKGTYTDALYLRKGGTDVGTVTFKVQDGGRVQVKAVSENGTYSATCPGAFRITPAGLGAVQTAIRKGDTLWACDALLQEDDGITGLACDYDRFGEDTHERIGEVVLEEVGASRIVR